MKKLILVFIITLLFSSPIFSQFISETRVDSVVNLVSLSSLTKFMRELTGDTATVVGGNPYLIFSRYSPSPGNPKAAQYIYEKFQSYSLNVRYQVGDSNTTNVIARKTGTRFPNQKVVIGAHYDNIIWPVNPQPLDTVHGADDNASGTIAVLEIARLIANMNFDYTIEFAAWDNEEIGLYGSTTYADTAYLHGDSIRFYINMDMISYNYQNQNKIQAGADSNSVFYNQLFETMKTRYLPQYLVYQVYARENGGSDYVPFVHRKYRSFSFLSYSITPYYHTILDDFANINMPYCRDFVKPILGMLMVVAGNKNAFFEHKPLVSTSDTTGKNIWAIIKFPDKLPVTANVPRLYYKINSAPYAYTNAYYKNLDTFKFSLPGASKGSLIKYYFAAQDSTGSFVCTYPVGGSGANPPGTAPPANPFWYAIYNNVSACSSTLPKPINDLQYTYDSIYISSTAYVNKVRLTLSLNHSNDGDLVIQLIGPPPNGMINLSQRNGMGGQNYINTIFDDTASLSITQGTPPFTGTFRPQVALSLFNNKPVSGYWVLRIYDVTAGNTGQLTSWCLNFETKANVGVTENNVPVKYELSQNYPNPFNPVTKINFSIQKNGFVTLKVFDVLGREVENLVNENRVAGNYSVEFNGSNLTSGLYFYRLEANGFTETKKMLLVK